MIIFLCACMNHIFLHLISFRQNPEWCYLCRQPIKCVSEAGSALLGLSDAYNIGLF